MASISQLKIELDGIGHILSDKRLGVPKYQRSYAWEKQNVEELLRDLSDAIRAKAGEYFLGSIVIQGADANLEIVDGQQRLATISIILGAIRDYLLEKSDTARAEQLEQKFLLSRNLRSQAIEPRLTLNADDNDFYRKAVLSRPTEDDRKVKPSKESHERIQTAQNYAADFIRSLTSTTQNASELLIDWAEYIEMSAKVIFVRVADDSNAFVIFETLNDRGVELSIADLLKNYLFGRSGERVDEAQTNWNQMVGALETVGGDDVLLSYIRQTWSAENGITREKDLFGAIKAKMVSEQIAIDFGKGLANNAKLYAAMLNPKHELWNQYGDTARGHIETLATLRLEQFRPLLLAILRSFKGGEVEKALRYLVSCSVRFLIHGGLGGGTLEKNYCDSAQKVLRGEITTAAGLASELNKVVPTDSEFFTSFASARVSKAYLARYYLQSIERQATGETQPELVPNTNANEVNLEHVLPQNPSPAWGQIEDEVADAFFNRIGNLALMKQKINSDIGNAGFDAKKGALTNSQFELTKKIADNDNWMPENIEIRQNELATLAIKAWPISGF